MLWILNFIIVL